MILTLRIVLEQAIGTQMHSQEDHTHQNIRIAAAWKERMILRTTVVSKNWSPENIAKVQERD